MEINSQWNKPTYSVKGHQFNQCDIKVLQAHLYKFCEIARVFSMYAAYYMTGTVSV